VKRPPLNRPTLTIVVPALNEEAVIESTLERCLAAREEICRRGELGNIEIVFVNDGSTDRTEELARRFAEITVLGFSRNQGYGAAIMCGFAHGEGELVGFLDADGTCDPLVFGDLCRAVVVEGADVALGSRLDAGTRMPLVRQIGNLFFRMILGLLSRLPVRDTASGMRVLRRDVLPYLYPLPEGLHFTPAMSARILLEDKLELVEIPMPYAVRVGRSKLSAVRDGVRFLVVILQAVATFRPARLVLPVAAATLVVAMAFGLPPLAAYLTSGRLVEGARLSALVASLFAALTAQLLSTAVISERIAATAHDRPFGYGGVTGTVSRLFKRRVRWAGVVGLLTLALVLIWPGLRSLAASGDFALHWSRAAATALCLLLAAVWVTTTFLLNMMDLIHTTRLRRVVSPVPDRARSRRSVSGDDAAAQPEAGVSPHSLRTG
jgi:hypothetical protein